MTLFIRILAALALQIAALQPGLTAERPPEKIRIAVSSKSLGFLDTFVVKTFLQ